MNKKHLIIFIMIITLFIAYKKSESTNTKSEFSTQTAYKAKKTTNTVDYSRFFNRISGSATFYNPKTNVYDLYNGELCKKKISPYSTFKIISTLMGLSQGIVNSLDDKLGYDGTKYSREELNKDLTLKEAFQLSAVWYYEKLINLLNKDYVQNTLTNLNYGNANISVWNKTGHNDFWLDSSLKISPIEQVEVLYKIFDEQTAFSINHIKILKEAMLFKTNDEYSIYGKTGSGKMGAAWYVGFLEKKSEKIYFAISLESEHQNVSGAIAREILIDIIKDHYAK